MFVAAMDDGGDEEKNKGLGGKEAERGTMILYVRRGVVVSV